MLGYLWKRFTASEGDHSDMSASVVFKDGSSHSVPRAVADGVSECFQRIYELSGTVECRSKEIESLKRQLQHKTDLAESYKGATERRDERIKDLEQQLAEANRKLSAIEAIFSVNLSPKGDKNDGDTAEYPAPVNAIADTTSQGE